MANLIAIDWDSHELRAVVGRSGSGGITITDTATVPLAGEEPATIVKTLADLMATTGVAKGKYKLLVTIGRGKAELRQLSLPPVPPNELPALVRFQAMQNFSTGGDAVAVDYLPVEVAEQSTSVIAGGVPPATMKLIASVAEAVGLELKRVALRPVAAAALFSLKSGGGADIDGDCVLVDLLADDAEIVVFRSGKVVFVRSVRMPEQTTGRTSQVAGEIRRSLMACSTESGGPVQRVIIWGQAKTHEQDVEQLRELLKCDVQTLDPLSLVANDSRHGTAESDFTRQHTGRLAPLVGLLAADAAAESSGGHSDLLVDFLNPRKTIEVEKDNRVLIGAGIGVAAAVLLVGYLAWSSIRTKNAEIAQRQAQLAGLKPQVTQAEESITRTERVDLFLDSSVNWLDQLRRLADRMPPSDQAIVKTINGVALPREGGGRLTLTAAATSPVVVDEMESALRDEVHSVRGTGANDLGAKENYRWGFSQMIDVMPNAIRETRYEAINRAMDEADRAATPETNQPANEPASGQAQ
jgi:Tfp pilus assembly PilM family ATPase